MNGKKVKRLLMGAVAVCVLSVVVVLIIKMSNISDTDASDDVVTVKSGEKKAENEDTMIGIGDGKTKTAHVEPGTDGVYGKIGGDEPENGDVKTEDTDVKTPDIKTSRVRGMDGPPSLTVTNLEESITANMGTYSWHIRMDDGRGQGIESDSTHPLFWKEHMEPLQIRPTVLSSVNPLRAVLKWDRMPYSVTVKCWGEEDWENYDAVTQGTPIDVETDDSDFDGEDDAYAIKLMDGDYIYEVYARFSEHEGASGNVYYGFYTQKFPITS